MADDTNARAEDRPDRPEVPGSCSETDREPDRQHDENHRQVRREVDLHAAPRRPPTSVLTLWIVAQNPVQR